MQETCDIVDEQDRVIRQATRAGMRKKNLLHRGVTIFVYNSKGEIFVHKRTLNKDIYPGYFDMTCGGGVHAGENYEVAAKRELFEELGIEDPPLEFLFNRRYKSSLDNFIAKVYKVVYDGKIILQKDEIEKGNFMKVDDLIKYMKKEKFCPDSIKNFKILQERNI